MTRLALLLVLFTGSALWADPPVAGYLFPAGGQRGSTVALRVGGLNLYDRCSWHVFGPGLVPSKVLSRTATRWFEGPLLPLPDSQRQEDYSADMSGDLRIAEDAPLGNRRIHLATSEGVTGPLLFQVGDLPEVIESEIPGDPLPVAVTLPVTINGRLFPKGNTDIWSFRASKGTPITCEVHAARLGSPGDARLEVFDAKKQLIAENEDYHGSDPLLAFIVPEDGLYHVHISDSTRTGSQRHVYRLRITPTPHLARVFPLGGAAGSKITLSLAGVGLGSTTSASVTLPNVKGRQLVEIPLSATQRVPMMMDVEQLPELHEGQALTSASAMLNGCIRKAGEVDHWAFKLSKGQTRHFESRGDPTSPLLAMLDVLDSAEKVVAQIDGTGTFTATKDDQYRLRVRDRWRSRGSDAFAYRIFVGSAPEPSFRITPESESLTLTREAVTKFRLNIVRQGESKEPITLHWEGLPKGVSVAPDKITANQTTVTLNFTTDKLTAIGPSLVTLRATSGTLTHTSEILVGVGLKAPFKVVGTYDLRLAPRGTIFRKTFKIERNGWSGPLEVRLADRQARHLQGVTGPVLHIAADQDQFEYPVTLPPWMETGRTSRACIMAIGKVKDGDREHTLSYTSQAQNDQVIAVVETGILALDVEKRSLELDRAKPVPLSVTVRRGKELTGDILIELIVPDHMHGVRAKSLTLKPSESRGNLEIHFAANAGPFNMPLIVRASHTTAAQRAVAEVKVEVGE